MRKWLIHLLGGYILTEDASNPLWARYQNQRYFLDQLESRLIKERAMLKLETERYIKMQDEITLSNEINAKQRVR